MGRNTTLIGAALVLGSALATGATRAGEREAAHWGAATDAPGHGWTRPAHAVAVVAHGQRPYQPPTRWDHDGDGIPNRHDRLYNPRWDRDGDGIPNRHDRYDNRQGGGHGRHAVPGWQRHP